MSPKKKKAPAAQNLIDSLLDERTPAPSDAHPQSQIAEPDAETRVISISRNTNPVDQLPEPTNSQSLVIDFGDQSKKPLKLETQPKSKPTPARNISQVSDDDEATVSLPDPEVYAEALKDSGNEGTFRIDDQNEESNLNRHGLTEIKTVVKMRQKAEAQEAQPQRPFNAMPAFGGFSSSEAALKQSESLRIAQNRITELEMELERLRRENEQLASAGETLRRRTDDLLSKTESLELQAKESERTHNEEKKVFRGQIQSKERDALELRGRLEEMEGRLESNFKKIRVRERELEHRLEIVKMESATLVSTKDKMILDLKRQIDQITHESDYGKQKTQELFNQYKEKQETIRRVVRALRIALTILEGDEDAAGLKKSE